MLLKVPPSFDKRAEFMELLKQQREREGEHQEDAEGCMRGEWSIPRPGFFPVPPAPEGYPPYV